MYDDEPDDCTEIDYQDGSDAEDDEPGDGDTSETTFADDDEE